MSRWFGPSGPWSVLCEDSARVPTPVGAPCLHCGETITVDDEGRVELCALGDRRFAERAIHRECSLRLSRGGANHQRGTCSCKGGPDAPDPPGLTLRQAARAAVAVWEAMHPS